ncbi:MAG: hypothetical protein MK137_03440 [Rickettsiales bacterium]|nr:hypothetical protein [Rickettsiales bacterium]
MPYNPRNDSGINQTHYSKLIRDIRQKTNANGIIDARDDVEDDIRRRLR